MGLCRPSTWPDRLVSEIAARQQGLVTRCQLTDLGLTRAMVDNAIARGRLIPVHRGVYAVADPSLLPLAPMMAAVLAVGRHAVLSHHSAAALWGLGGAQPRDAIDVTVAGRDAGRTRRGITVHLVAALDPRDATTHHGIPIVSAARALHEIAPDLEDDVLARSFDRALKEKLLTRHGLAATVARYPHRSGGPRLAALARAELRASDDTASEIEARFADLVRAGGLPEPEINVTLLGRYKVDALWRRHRLIVELDGYEYHSTRWSFEADHERDLALTAAGFVVMRFTRDQVVNHPEAVLVAVTRRLAALESQSGRSSLIVS